MVQQRIAALAMYYLGMRDCGCLLTIEEFAGATAPGLAGEIAAAVARIEAEAAAPFAAASVVYPTAKGIKVTAEASNFLGGRCSERHPSTTSIAGAAMAGKTCGFTDESGARCGRERRSSSSYCPEHHSLMTQRATARRADRPRRCAFVEGCGVLLDDTNSFRSAPSYCKTHHYELSQRARAARDPHAPRWCAFVEDDGARCGLLLNAENSHPTAPYYCREHQVVMTTRARERRERPQ